MTLDRLLAFDRDGVLLAETTFDRCVSETVAYYDQGREITNEELKDAKKMTMNDWEITRIILEKRGLFLNEPKESLMNDKIVPKFMSLYDTYKGNESWLADNALLQKLSELYHLAIVSGAPRNDIIASLEKNNANQLFRKVYGFTGDKPSEDSKYHDLKDCMQALNLDKAYFCDDRPTQIRHVHRLVEEGKNIKIFGIRPPNEKENYDQSLIKEGAIQVFPNVNDYCRYLLNEAER